MTKITSSGRSRSISPDDLSLAPEQIPARRVTVFEKAPDQAGYFVAVMVRGILLR
jgi:hypothetical protein